MRKLLREPLVHFLGLGLLVFLLDSFWTGGPSEGERTIVVSKASLARLDDSWTRTTGRAPSEEDRRGLISQFVEEEALAREAERLGLAEGDEIVKRRLAQKMRFIAAGSGGEADPSDAELESWFNENRDQFNIAERRSFIHVYFSPERHGEQVEARALAARQQLTGGADWRSLGDPFMQKRSHVTVPQGEVQRAFGPDFAEALFQLPQGEWSDPVGSAFGLHLVRIEAVDDAAEADFAANKPRIKDAYVEAMGAARTRTEIDRIIGRYEVVIAGD